MLLVGMSNNFRANPGSQLQPDCTNKPVFDVNMGTRSNVWLQLFCEPSTWPDSLARLLVRGASNLQLQQGHTGILVHTGSVLHGGLSAMQPRRGHAHCQFPIVWYVVAMHA